MMARAEIWRRQKVRIYRLLYEFTQAQCSDCAITDCACKDSICAHVEAEAKKCGVQFPKQGGRLRYLGCSGCVVPPHWRETCTIYLCESAQSQVNFPRAKYARLRDICARLEWKLLQLQS